MASLKEQYDSFMQMLEEKGVPQPRLVVPAIAVLVLAAVLFFVMPTLLPSNATVQLKLQSPDGKAVPNAAVTLVAGQKEFSAVSDSSGQVVFKNVPAGQKLQLRVVASGFLSDPKRISYDDSIVVLQPDGSSVTNVPIAFSVQVLTEQRVPLEAAIVRFSTDDGAPQTGATDPFGEAKINLGSKDDRVTVEVTKDGYKAQRKSVITADQKSVEIVLEAVESTPTPQPAAQSVLITVSDENGAPVSGVFVKLIDYNTQTPFRQATTDSSGQARLDRVDSNKQFTVSVEDSRRRYFAYSSDNPTTASAEPSIFVTLNAAPANDQLVILVKDKAGNPVSDATVTAYDFSKKTYLSTVASDSSGRAALTIDQPTARVTVYAAGYVPVALTVKNKEERSVILESAEGKTVSVKITVQKNLEPAPEAEVQIYSSDGFPLGFSTQYSDADGTTVFEVPKMSSAIYAQATLGSSTGQSDRAVPQSNVEWSVTLLPPQVPFKVTVMDAVNDKPVNGATVRFVTTAEKTTCKTKEGTCQVNVPAETDFKVIVEHPTYLPYQSTPQLVLSDQKTASHSARLYPKALTQSAVVQFQGFFNSDGQLLRETSNAQIVSSRFLVSLPAASADDSARFTVRLAETPGTPIALITRASGTDVFYTGSDPSAACNPPVSDNNSEMGQWVVFEFPKGFSGTQQVSVEYFIQGSAKPPDALTIAYDLHGLRKGVPFVFPLDSEKLQQLLQQPSVSDGDFCGQKTVSQRLAVSRDVLTCDSALCSKAVFVTSDGQRFASTAQITAGSAFGIDLELIGLESGISKVQIQAPTVIQLLELQIQDGTSSSQTRTDLASDETASNSVSVSVSASKNQKIKLHLDAKAVRASALAEITVTVEDSDGAQQSFVRNLVISGTNRFTITPSLTELESGLSQTLRVTVKDQFGKPVNDATVELFECDSSPFNGQSFVSSDSKSGSYSFKIHPSSFGTAGIRATHPQFLTAEECVLPVRAVDFLTAEPESFTLKGDTQKDTVTERITLTSLLEVKSKVSSSVKCTDSSGAEAAAPLTISPNSLTLKESATVQVQANPQAFKGRCEIVFLAKINKNNAAASLVTVDVDLKGPPAPGQLCPTAQPGVKCLTTADAKDLRCTKTALQCQEQGQSCYQCNFGPQTLPNQITLSVSNYQSDATQAFAISLEEQPEECRVEGFTNNPAYAPYGYNNPYGANPYGYLNNYVAPNSYYSYQPNAYVPYSTNPWINPGTFPNANPALSACMPYTGSYPYGSTYASNYPAAYPATNPAAYPAGYPATYPGTLNPATTSGSYPVNPNLANPATPYANCQAIIAKLSPYCQPYFTQYNQYNTNQNYYGNSYRDPWSNTLNPTYPSPNSFQYPQQRPTVNVQADCTRTEIRVTAQYTGGDQSYGGALGGNQQGFLLIRTGGQTKQIPITVITNTPFAPGTYPGGYPGGYNPSGYPTNQLPPQCILEYQQAVQQAYQTQTTTPQEGLDETGLPDTIDVYYNKYTGYGAYERQLKAPSGGKLSFTKPTSSTATISMSYDSGKLKVTVQCKKTKESAYDCAQDTQFKATWTFANLQTVQKDRALRISQDDFTPVILQLLPTKDVKDAAIFDVSTSGDFSKAKCKEPAGVKCRAADSQISAEASAAIKDGKLEIRELGDYQIRQIPVRASTIQSSINVKAGEAESEYDFSGPLATAPKCEVVNADKSDVKAAVEVTCTNKHVKIKPKETITGVQKGWIEFTFEDSDRNYDKVKPEGFKPKILLTAEGKDAVTQIVLNAADPQTVGQDFTASYKFPAGDDKTKRSITLTLQDASGKQLEQVRREASVLQQDEGTISAPFDKPGTVFIRAETMLGGKLLQNPPLQVKLQAAGASDSGPQAVSVKLQNSKFDPNPVKVKAGSPIKLTITRLDEGGCATSVEFYTLGKKADLPKDKPVTFDLPAMQAGQELEYGCPMKMIKGKIIAEAAPSQTPDSSPAPEGGPTTPEDGPGTTTGTPPSGSILKTLKVSRGSSSGSATNEIIVESKLGVESSKIKRFRLFIFKTGARDKISFEQNTGASDFVKSGSDTFIKIRLIDLTPPPGTMPAGEKLYKRFTLVKEFLEKNGNAVFALAALDKDQSGANSLGRAQTTVKASDLGFSPSTSPAPAPGPSTGTKMSKNCQGNGAYLKCWLSDQAARYRCTEFLDNGYGLCLLSGFEPNKVGVSISGGDGKCGNLVQETNLRNEPVPFFTRCKNFQFNILAVRPATAEDGVSGNVVEVDLAQTSGGLDTRVKRIPLRMTESERCTGSGTHRVICKLNPGVASQRCTETTSQNAVVCANWIALKGGYTMGVNMPYVQLKVMTNYGTCGFSDNGKLVSNRNWLNDQLEPGMVSSQCYRPDFYAQVGPIDANAGFATVTLIDN